MRLRSPVAVAAVSAGDGLAGRRRPLVSAIITTHNRAVLLPEALDSVLAQEDAGSRFDLEVVVVDDGSTDSTPDIVRRYPDVRYVRLLENRGLPAARNAGIKASRGQYVAFLDDDDLWLPGKLRHQVPVLEARPDVAVVYGQHILRNGDREEIVPERAASGWVFRALLMDHAFGPGVHTFLVRRDAFDAAGDFDEGLCSAEDYDMWLRLAFRFPFLFVRKAVAVYRSSPHGMFRSQAAAGRAERAVRAVYERALARLPDGPDTAALKREARAHLELRIASQMCSAGRLEQARTLTTTALNVFPGIVDDPAARTFFTYLAGQSVIAGSSAGRAWALPAEFNAAVSRHASGLRGRWRMRRLQSDVWAGIAIGLSARPNADDRRAGLAALRAVLHDPAKAMRMGLLWRIGRAAIGRRGADAT